MYQPNVLYMAEMFMSEVQDNLGHLSKNSDGTHSSMKMSRDMKCSEKEDHRNLSLVEKHTS